MRYYVYILKSKKDSSLYTGYTTDIKARIERHNSGRVVSTKSKIPLETVYFEMHSTLKDALLREKYLKSSKAKTLKDSLRI